MRSLLTSIFVLSACASSPAAPFPLPYSWADEVESRTFQLTYTNRTDRTVCLAPDNWPNEAGKVDQASSILWVTIVGKKYHIEDFNTGYCPDCAVRVRPGQQVAASLRYDDFSIPEELYQARKTLHFDAVGFTC